MALRNKKIIILVEQMFNDQEFWYPYYRLKEAGIGRYTQGPHGYLVLCH